MKFKLPRQIPTQEISDIISREIKRQGTVVVRASKNNLKEMAEVIQEIKKKGLPENLLCKKLPEEMGSGIFLHPKAKPILKGQVIAPYAGELSLVPQNEPDDSGYSFALLNDITLSKQEHLLLEDEYPYHPRRLYLLNLDAQDEGNFTRFINHSEKPNVIAHLFRIPKNSFGLKPSPIEVIYLAKKTILPGEQLLVSYEDGEKSYWGPMKIKPYPVTPKTFQVNEALEVVFLKPPSK